MSKGHARRWVVASAAVVVTGLAVAFLSRGAGPQRDPVDPTGAAGIHPAGEPAGRGLELDLSGQWTLTTTRQRSLAVSLRREGPRRWQLAGVRPTVFDGGYVSRGDSLVMVTSPGSYHSLVWVAASGAATVSAVYTLTNTAYASATLRRGAPAAAAPVDLPLPHPPGRVPEPPGAMTP